MILIENLSNFVIMVASATYYWNNDRAKTDTQADADLGLAWWITYCNHFGTLAIGSFVCAVVTILKYTVMLVCYQLEKISGDNACANCVKGCV